MALDPTREDKLARAKLELQLAKDSLENADELLKQVGVFDDVEVESRGSHHVLGMYSTRLDFVTK